MTAADVVRCGVDEAGRGPLAGPVYAAAVILGADHGIQGLDDSKKLSPALREILKLQIKQRALAWAISAASVEEIDTLNILQATLLAMRRAVEKLRMAPGEVLVDGTHCPKIQVPARAIVRGDSTVAEISAASILAKTARDALMRRLDRAYPQYGFSRHKGYGTRQHLIALQSHGVSPVHRRSFEPVRSMLENC